MIVAIDGNAINGAEGVVAAVRDHEPGDTTAIVVVRDGAAPDDRGHPRPAPLTHPWPGGANCYRVDSRGYPLVT